MSDTPMPETLERLAAQITALSEVVKTGFTSIEASFDRKLDETRTQLDVKIGAVDRRLDETRAQLGVKIDAVDRRLDETRAQLGVKIDAVDRKLDETRAHLGIKIEAVDTRVTQVYDAVIVLTAHGRQNRKDHQRFDKKVEEHDVRILALEHPERPKRRAR